MYIHCISLVKQLHEFKEKLTTIFCNVSSKSDNLYFSYISYALPDAVYLEMFVMFVKVSTRLYANSYRPPSALSLQDSMMKKIVLLCFSWKKKKQQKFYVCFNTTTTSFSEKKKRKFSLMSHLNPISYIMSRIMNISTMWYKTNENSR